MRAALFYYGGDNVSNWLVICAKAEFIVQGETLLDAKIAVYSALPKYGLKRNTPYELYRLRRFPYGEY